MVSFWSSYVCQNHIINNKMATVCAHLMLGHAMAVQDSHIDMCVE